MNVLITGGAGFIGSHLAERFQGRARVRVLDDLRSGRRENLAGLDVELIEGSILDSTALRRAMAGVTHVFHLAALVSVPESVRDPHLCVALNVTGVLNVLAAAAEARVSKVCFASSAAVYGEEASSPKREDMRPDPRSPYAVTKLDGEYYCGQYTTAGRVDTVSLRFFNVFGPRQDPSGPYGAVIPMFFREALAGRPLTIHGDGGQTRDFIHVRDIAAALEFAATRPGLTGVFNAGYGRALTVRELATQVLALTGSHSEIVFGPGRAGDVRHSCADVSRLRAAGFRPEGSVEEGLRDLHAAFVRSSESNVTLR